jgi:hypothetical protein
MLSKLTKNKLIKDGEQSKAKRHFVLQNGPFLVYIPLNTRFKPFFNEAIDNILQKAERIYRFAQHPTVIYKLTW